VTGYQLDGPRNRIPVGAIFCTRPDRSWGPPRLLYNGYRVTFPEVKQPGLGVNHPSPSRAEVKVRVALCIYSLSGPSWPVLGWPLPCKGKIARDAKVSVANSVVVTPAIQRRMVDSS